MSLLGGVTQYLWFPGHMFGKKSIFFLILRKSVFIENFGHFTIFWGGFFSVKSRLVASVCV